MKDDVPFIINLYRYCTIELTFLVYYKFPCAMAKPKSLNQREAKG
jgi:hypothetical protein